MNQTEERLDKKETCLKNRNECEERDLNCNKHEEECGPLTQHYRRNEQNPDAQYLKSIKIDVPTFDGRDDPELFLDWTQQIDKYFTWYDLMSLEKLSLPQ